MSGLLPMLILLPLVGGSLLLFFATQVGYDTFAKRASLLFSGLTLLLSLLVIGGVIVRTRPDAVSRQDTTEATAPKEVLTATEAKLAVTGVEASIRFQPSWFSVHRSVDSRLQLALGVDGLGASLVLLTTIVVFIVLLFAGSSVLDKFASYAGWMLLSEAGLLIVFLSMDLILFYVGFELALLPLLVLISRWGQEDARVVGKRFVLFTLTGSIPMVLAFIGIIWSYSTGEGPTVLFEELSRRAMVAAPSTRPVDQAWIFGLLMFGLGIKMAILPFHTWLPATYRASHPTTTALLAAVVLKLGLFGFLRIALPMVPVACFEYGPGIMGTLGAIAIVYGAMAALGQTDIRLLLAYSSLSHVGFISLGMFALNEEGIAGASLQMFNHGITTAAMFLLAGCIVARRGTADIVAAGHGLASVYPRLGTFFLFFTFAGAGMPGLNNFVGEIMALSAMMTRSPVLSVVAATGILLGAWYALRLARDILFGNAEKADRTRQGSKKLTTLDLSPQEWAPVAALAVLSIVLGCFPQSAMNLIKNDVQRLSNVYSQVEIWSKSGGVQAKLEFRDSTRLASEKGPRLP